METAILRKRFKALREKREMTQDELSQLMGFKDRQTITAIESGERRLTAEELIRAAGIFNVTFEAFTDPFRLVGEGRFSWRQSRVAREQLEQVEETSGRWIAVYRHILRLKGDATTLIMPRIVTPSDVGEACLLGERFAEEFDLGSVPAERLQDVMESKLSTLVLHVDAIANVSGAACQLPELNAIIVNRNEVEGRRNFDVAHELFHLLTWDVFPPAHYEEISDGRRTTVERYADSFASGLLMPLKVLKPYLSDRTREDINAWLNTTATALMVTSTALRVRLSAAGLLSPKERNQIDDTKLRNNGQTITRDEKPRLFSKPFLEVLGWGISKGHISIRRATEVLGISIDELSMLYREYGIQAPFEI